MNKPLENHIDVEGLENLKAGEGIKVDKETKYDYVGDFQTEGAPLIDPGQGKSVMIRKLKFNIDPTKIKFVPKNKQQLFNDHAKFIERLLWGDGLIRLEGVNPRVIINKKRLFYEILVPCEARRGIMFMEKPHNLSQLLAKEAKDGKLDPKTK